MHAPAASAAAGTLILLGLHGLLAVGIGIERFALPEGHIQPLGFIACFQLRAASRDQQQRDYDKPPLHELLRFHVVISPPKRYPKWANDVKRAIHRL
jgi:hypothetical protein